MKALLYKEFTLAMHPICYVFMLFSFMVIIPSYPIAIGFIYVLSSYPILFLGANKGQQSNDLLFSTLLPVRKKDIVLARILTVMIMHFTFILLCSALVPVGFMVQDSIIAQGGELEDTGLGLNAFVSILAIVLVGYSIADLVFFPIYYKKGRSIVMSTLLTILSFVIYLSVFTVVIPLIPGAEGYEAFLANENLLIQFALLVGALVFYAAAHFLVYKISSKRLERVDL